MFLQKRLMDVPCGNLSMVVRGRVGCVNYFCEKSSLDVWQEFGYASDVDIISAIISKI